MTVPTPPSTATTSTTIDVARLRRELEFVTTQPERWDQTCWVSVPRDLRDPIDVEPGVDWTCRTTACLAGWTALHADHEPDVRYDSLVRAPGGDLVDVAIVARRLLGLSYEQTDLLFHAECTLRDLWEFASAFTDGAIVVPANVRVLPVHVFRVDDVDYYRDLGRDDDGEYDDGDRR